jgi:hypothetical protein
MSGIALIFGEVSGIPDDAAYAGAPTVGQAQVAAEGGTP